MTVQELMDVMDFCDLLEVVVRKNGRGWWIQGYRVGNGAKIFPAEYTVEEWEKHKFRPAERKTVYLNKGEEVDIRHGYNLPMKVICRNCHKLPEYIGRLEVCSAQPRHVPQFHREALTHNDFALEVNCYPEEYVPEMPEETETALDGQIDIFDYMKEVD